MVGLPQKLDRDSTILVVSELPLDECDEILQGVYGSANRPFASIHLYRS
jgi:hypothetical protein